MGLLNGRLERTMKENTDLQAIKEYIQNDAFANHLGAVVKILEPGHSRVSLTIKDTMTNFHGFTHGSVIFAIGDMAFAAACNSHGKTAVALSVNISFLRPSFSEDRLVAETKEVNRTRRTGLYETRVYNEDTGQLIAKSQDQAFRKETCFVQAIES